MDLAGYRGDVARERLYVSREQFLDTSELKYLVDYRVFVRKRAKCFLVGRICVSDSCLRLLFRVKAKFFEDEHSDLLRGEDVQRRLLRHFSDSILDCIHLDIQSGRILSQLCKINPHTLHLHVREDFQQWLLHVYIECLDSVDIHVFPYCLSKKEGHCNFLSLAWLSVIFRNFIEKRKSLHSLRNTFAFLKIHIQVCLCKNLNLMCLFRIDQVVHQLNVHQSAFQTYACMCKEVSLELEIISVFGDLRIRNDLCEIYCLAFRSHCSCCYCYTVDLAEYALCLTFCYNGTFSKLLCLLDDLCRCLLCKLYLLCFLWS